MMTKLSNENWDALARILVDFGGEISDTPQRTEPEKADWCGTVTASSLDALHGFFAAVCDLWCFLFYLPFPVLAPAVEQPRIVYTNKLVTARRTHFLVPYPIYVQPLYPGILLDPCEVKAICIVQHRAFLPNIHDKPSWILVSPRPEIFSSFGIINHVLTPLLIAPFHADYVVTRRS